MRYPNAEAFGRGFQTSPAMLAEVVAEGERAGVARDAASLDAQRTLICSMLKAYIGLALFGNEAFHAAYLPVDEDLNQTLNMKL